MNPTFRIFVSSTFTDLRAERDALQHHVFPRLRELCERGGARFQAIDLRWGVSEEAALDQQTVNVCLTEIKRCQGVTARPNFIVLLGDRYGWRCLPPQVEKTEFDAILENVPEAERELLRWEDGQPEDRKGWYRLDENAVAPGYRLRPRTLGVAAGASADEQRAARESEEREWSRTEQLLRSALRGAIDELGWSEGDHRQAKYETSATEQEIEFGAMRVEDAREHVFAFFRELDTTRGRRLVDDLPPGQEAGQFLDLLPEGGLDTEARGRLERLKDRLRVRLDGNIHDYRGTWAEDGISTDHIGELPESVEECLDLLDDDTAPHTLCVDVWKRLATVIRGQLERLGATASEAESHERFAKARTTVFVGRTAMLAAIDDYLTGTDTDLCVVVGAPGSGKSALLAKAAERARAAHPDAVVVDRYIGASPGSSDIRTLLADLCQVISAAYNDTTPVPSEYQELVSELPKRLERASADKPLVLFLDALDQLSESQGARNLVWLPGSLPEHARVVVSTRHELPEPLQFEHPMPRCLRLDRLSREEGDELLGKWLMAAGRTLQPDQREHVLDAFDRAGGMPLYLKLAFEEACLWRSHTPPERLGDDISGVVRDNLFARLSQEEHHGALLVDRSLAFLAASRYGLAEDELLDMLARDDELYENVKAEARHELSERDGDRRLPVVLWSRLSFDLEAYLTERLTDSGSLLDFYHPELGDIAAEAYLAAEVGQQRHAALAEYFRSKIDPQRLGTWTGADTRGLSELPYHLAHSGGREAELFETLSDFRFLERKAAEVGVVEHKGADGAPAKTYTGVFKLQDDFKLALRTFGGIAATSRWPLIVTAVDFGDGPKVRCPWCNTLHSFEEAWRGREIKCPNERCKGPLLASPFVVGESPGVSRTR